MTGKNPDMRWINCVKLKTNESECDMKINLLQQIRYCIICFTLLSVQCSKHSDPYVTPSNGSVPVSLSLSTEWASLSGNRNDGVIRSPSTYVGTGTRAVINPSSTDETAVRNLWVLQYDMSTSAGALVGRTHVANIIQDGTSIRCRAELKPLAKTRIVVIANDPGNITSSTPADNSSLDALNNMTYRITGNGLGIPSDASLLLPMRSESEDMTLAEGVATSVQLPLTRLVTKMHVTIDNRCKETYPRFEVTSATLRNVPALGSYDMITRSKYMNMLFPRGTSQNFNHLASPNVTSDQELIEYQWYMAPNCRGVGTASNPSEKNALTAPINQGAYCTYINVKGRMYETEDGAGTPLTFSVYLGSNSTDDYNLWANIAYNLVIVIKDISVVASDDQQLVIEVLDWNGNYTLYPKGWELV